MVIGFAGMTHLGQTMAQAAEMRGCHAVRVARDGCYGDLASCALVCVTEDVESEADVASVRGIVGKVIDAVASDQTPVVIMSQVPPGFTRSFIADHPVLFYQVDTLIMNCALDRALNPERHIVGCANPDIPLPSAYHHYLACFPAPVLRIGIEAAELAKLAINFMLAAQISAANTLASIADGLGASWVEISSALRTDCRIGAHAYIEPGLIGGHLPRDVCRIRECVREPSFANAIGPLA